MSKGMLGMFAASLLALAACADVGEDLETQDGQEESELLEHRGRRCNDSDAKSDEGGGNGGSSAESKRGSRRRSRGCESGSNARDGGSAQRPDAGAPAVGRDAGSVVTRDAGSVVVTRDAGAVPPAERDAGRVVPPPSDDDDDQPTGPDIVDVDRDVITLPDGSTVRLDRSCPNYATPFAVTLPGCCLPAGACGLSTHALDVAGVPKGCFSYAQGKTLDPNFNLPEKSCSR